MYVIIEIQTNADNTVGILSFYNNDWNEAQAIFHEKLAYAARSSLPCHAVALMDNQGRPLDFKYFEHGNASA